MCGVFALALRMTDRYFPSMKLILHAACGSGKIVKVVVSDPADATPPTLLRVRLDDVLCRKWASIVSAIHVAICIGRTIDILWTDTTQGTRRWRHSLCRYKDSRLSRFFGISPRVRHGCPRSRFPKQRFLRIRLSSWLERSEKYRCHDFRG